MLIGLIEVNNLALVKNDAALNASCHESDKPTVRAMAAIIEQIYKDFNYRYSTEFMQKIDSKSEHAQTMHRKLLGAQKLR